MKPNKVNTADYVVKTDDGELPRGSHFTVWPGAVKAGQLCLFRTHKRHIIGRWIPNVAGHDFIWQPERWIRVAAEHIGTLQILGVIIPAEAPLKSITDLAPKEDEHLFDNHFPRLLSE